jgi:hypothetical protein
MQLDHGAGDRAPVGAGVPAAPVYAAVPDAWEAAVGVWAGALEPVLAAACGEAMATGVSALSEGGRLRLVLYPMTRRPSKPKKPH